MKKTDNSLKLAKILNDNNLLKPVIQTLANLFPAVSKESFEKIAALFAMKDNKKGLLSDYAALYSKNYTPSEINGLIRFYSSKLGKKHRKCALETFSESLEIGHRWGENIIKNHVGEIMQILEDNDKKGMENRGIDSFQQKRLEFALNYATDQGWNPKELTMAQIIEIRKQDGWKNPEGNI